MTKCRSAPVVRTAISSAMKKSAGRRRLMSASSSNERSVTFMRSDTSYNNKDQQRRNAVDVQIIQDQVLFSGSSRPVSAISRGSSKAPIVAGYNSVSRCTPIIVSWSMIFLKSQSVNFIIINKLVD